ncbi:MAG: asparaginase [Candidatus Dormibacteria bacterium]
MSRSPVHLATLWRGEAREAVVRGHVVVADAGGRVLATAGDPDAPTTLRSCVKPLQAQPFVHLALDRLGAGDDELAIACASHAGEPRHVQTVSSLLGRAGLGEGALSCGPQLPFDDLSARRLLAAGGGPARLTNNCSGKHAAMAVTCAVSGWPLEGYTAASHPLQVEIRRRMSAWLGIDLSTAPAGMDGCGLPTHEVPLRALARSFAAAASDDGFRRCQAAMATHPHLVAGRHRFDTDLLAVAGTTLTCKGGGGAVWVAVRRPAGPAVAIKLEAGDATGMAVVALTALGATGLVDAQLLDSPALARHRQALHCNWAGDVVGRVAAEPGWADRLALSGVERCG